MPAGKRKKFIDKKNAVTFQLVHRSQKDPLQADETAPKHVLLEKRTGRPLLLPDDLSTHGKASLEKRKEEQRKYGIYFDDDYNYLQHLKDVNRVADWEPVVQRVRVADDTSGEGPTEKKGIRLPSSVFQSNVEEKEGLLNKAAPQSGPRPDWDPDVVAALDDDFDFEDEDNVLEDDFIKLADGPVEDGMEGVDDGAMEDDDSDNYVTDDEEEVGSDDEEDGSSEGGFSFAEEEVRSRFTNYSMSSSVIRRTEGLKTLDERFEQMFEQYDDLELGALDGEEIEGCLQPDSEIMKQIVEDYQRKTRLPTLKEVMMQERANMAPITMESIAEEDELVDMRLDNEAAKERWDCESIISTYSNLYNHPKLIKEPKKDKVQLSSRTGLPVKDKGGLSRQGLKRLEQELGEEEDDRDETRSRTSVASSIRPKNETPEERRLRKAQVRALRKERRQEKKANSLAFKAEELRQEKAMANVRKNLTSMRLM